MTSRFPIHSRFASGLAAVGGGMFLAIVSRVWATGTVEWIGLIVGAVAVLGGLAAASMTARGTVERGIDLAIVLVGAWTLVASLAYSGTTRLDLALWSGVAFGVLGALGLIVHEQTTERVVHELEVTHRAEARTPIAH